MKMRTIMMLTGCLWLGIGNAQAAGLLDWLGTGGTEAKQAAPADAARLLTLEPGQNEMYPQASPDGKHLLVVAIDERGKRAWISNRATENGDPLHVVTDDVRAPGSVRWHGHDAVSFLSQRAGSLGLWTRAADGKGLVRRVAELGNGLTQPVLLPGGGMLAMRVIVGQARQSGRTSQASDGFDNWSFSGARTEIVRVDTDGTEHVLANGANPALSPDGQWVAFSMPTGRSMHLFMMRTDGSALMQLTDARCIDVQPAWSPDGQWLVFASNRADADMRHPSKGNWDIWAIDREGRNLMRLTLDAARDGAPSVGTDGNVYFHSDRKIGRELSKAHQVKGQTGGFHVWRVALSLPKMAMH